MQLSRIYSNRPKIFAPIDFNHGAGHLNVVLGEVRKPKDKDRDSHNLGKTTLLHLIDFMMLKGLSPEHFLSKHRSIFSGFVFFLEVRLNSGDYATIRRGVEAPTSISLKRHPLPGQDFSKSPQDAWDHVDLPIGEAIKLVDAWLDLRILKPYDYRKAITYFLRSQADWGDELALQKFQSGKDVYWKPFVARLFGFNESLIQRKYELDESIQKHKEKQAEQQAEVRYKENDLPELNATLTVLRQQVDEVGEQLDNFKFDDQERAIVRQLVEGVEAEIAILNQRIYDVRYDINQIDIALDHKDKFDINEVGSIFREAKLYFPDQLKKEYEDLVSFKKLVTQERNAALRKRRKTLAAEQEEAEARKNTLDTEREQKLRILRNRDTLEKFKALQKEATKQRVHLEFLDGQKNKLESLVAVARNIRELERQRARVIDETEAMIQKSTPVVQKFTRLFNEYCSRVMKREGIFYLNVNSQGNLDYKISLGLAGQQGKPSSLSEGTSYKKLVCALFDLALLKVYEDAPFFHFVYHDGMFEALDDRKKTSFIELVREQIAGGKTQYIMTVIASDLPRDEKGKVIGFTDDEIILRLHDIGNAGRLFKIAEF